MKKYILLIFISTVLNCCLGGQFFGNISNDLKNLKPTSKAFGYFLNLENINEFYFSYQDFNENFTYTGLFLWDKDLQFAEYDPELRTVREIEIPSALLDLKSLDIKNKFYDDELNLLLMTTVNNSIYVYSFEKNSHYSFYVDFDNTTESTSLKDAYYDIKEKVFVFSKTLPLQVFRLDVLKNTTEMFNIKGVFIGQNLKSYVSSYKNQFVFLGKNETNPVMMLYQFNTNTKSLELLFQTDKKVKYSSINLVRGLNPRFVYFSNINTNAEGYLFDLETKTIESFNTIKKNRHYEYSITSEVSNEFLTSIVPNFRYVPVAYDSSYYYEYVNTALSVNSFNLSLGFIILLSSLLFI
ncbi:hypothetical protein DICPUDRAFT_79839 [Dictyostelium purpureum]|uniref:Uncharacterized protein n=1 Tax=Dictyostelium purpureum TaxID=5786 RepID=F0ZNS4_DICPU|nr:uncharacterized protein DICPUDRAFT_79839 [Dictyostelium purpureum]EGC34403.1 hypothetical protein DICPUDRAFT_79839 [Dictyostelium purpureum]|eukprot:XP_003289077.1 hypothetical protein DICPUDRAFT_79839 [Dictyostelium purpureum]